MPQVTRETQENRFGENGTDKNTKRVGSTKGESERRDRPEKRRATKPCGTKRVFPWYR